VDLAGFAAVSFELQCSRSQAEDLRLRLESGASLVEGPGLSADVVLPKDAIGTSARVVTVPLEEFYRPIGTFEPICAARLTLFGGGTVPPVIYTVDKVRFLVGGEAPVPSSSR
jgi:hypothetical protein